MKCFYLSNIDDCKEPFTGKKWEYKFFDYSYFYEQDNIIGLWQRVVAMVYIFKPDLILLNFKHPNMINDYELKTLSTFAVVVIINNG